MFKNIFKLLVFQLVDSEIESTREYMRKKYFQASDKEAKDSRPFIVVLTERDGLKHHEKDIS